MHTEPAPHPALTDVYTPPQSPSALPSAAAKPARFPDFAWLAMSMGIFTLTIALALVVPGRIESLARAIAVIGFGASALLALRGAVAAVGAIVRRPSEGRRPLPTIGHVLCL